MSPRVGFSDKKRRRRSVVLPAPEGPVRNWNELGSMPKETSFSTSGPIPYLNPTFSNRTTVATFARIAHVKAKQA